MPDSEKPKLTDRQRIFVSEYVQHWNATRAAEAAGYSQKTARIQGAQQLRIDKVRQAIEDALSERVMQRNEVLARLASQARGSIADFMEVDDDGEFVRFVFTPDRPLHLIKSLQKTDKGVKLELYDAQAAQQLIGRHLGLFQPDQQANVSVNLQVTADDLARARNEIREFEAAIEPGDNPGA